MKKRSETSRKLSLSTEFNETERAILEAYLRLSISSNVTEITLQKIAKEAQVAFGTVRYYFADRSLDLLQAALIFIFKEGYEYIESRISKERMKSDSRDFFALECYIKANFDWLRNRYGHAHLIVFYYYLSSTQTKMEITSDQFFETARKRIEAYLLEGAGAGLFQKPKDVKRTAHQIHGALVGLMVNAISESYPKKLKSCEAEAISLIETILGIAH